MENLQVYRSPYPKLRIGNKGDGGYVITDIPTQYDVIISGGVSNDISFEHEFLNNYPNTECFAFDGTVNSLPMHDNRVTFIQKNLGQFETETTTNLESYLDKYDNIFLKLDIEGHEFRLFPSIYKYLHKVKQIVIEIHSSFDIHTHPDYYQGLNDITHDSMFSLLNNINKTHTLVHIHANNGCGLANINGIPIPYVFECTYIRSDFVPNKLQNDTPFPSQLDYPNIRKNPQYILQGFPYSTLYHKQPIIKGLSYLRAFR